MSIQMPHQHFYYGYARLCACGMVEGEAAGEQGHGKERPMGAVDVNLWGSMSPDAAGQAVSFQEQHQGDGPGSYRETIERVKARLDEYATALESKASEVQRDRRRHLDTQRGVKSVRSTSPGGPVPG